MGPCPRLKWSLCKIFFFLFSKWFCTDIILYLKTLSTFLSPPWLITFLLLLIKINRGHVRHVRCVKFLHVLFMQLYKNIHYFQFDFPCFLLFIYCLAVCLSSFKWNCQRQVHIIDFLKLMSVVSIVHQNLYLSTWTKYTYYCYSGNCQQKYFLRWL